MNITRKNIGKRILQKGWIWIAMAAPLYLGSCEGNTSLAPTVSHEGEINIQLQLGVNNISPRENNTWDAAQQVNDMRIYLFRCPESEGKDGSYTFYIPQDLATQNKSYYAVSSFNNQSPYYSAEHDGKYEQHIFDFTPTLESGYYYKLLAVGRDDKYTTNHKLAEPTFTTLNTTFENATLALSESNLATASNETLASTELFTGKLQENDQEDGKDDALLVNDDNQEFNRTITLKRTVAGLMFYVQNIPSVVEDNTTDSDTPIQFTPTTLTLEATSIATDVNLASRTATGNTVRNNQALASIDLSADGWTNDATEHIFTRPADKENGWLENSYMATNYMMPTQEASMGTGLNAESKADNKKVTFYLHYTDGTHHRYDNVKLATNDGYLLAFPIQANHLYAIGQKSKTDNEPYDLKKFYQTVMVDITIEIEPAFDKKHEFDVK